ncbi:MAG: lipid-A-disaccharide synthase, partial [Proteobacteria bacterium]|nr:lipid-A-disaccharide synthase [Pseudomonadota bacterium]
MPKKIFISSGEESGDHHGAALITALKESEPELVVRGMGGRAMREAGLIGLDSKEVSVVGITEVVARLPKIMSALGVLKKELRTGNFDAVVLIDFPDFNLKLAAEAKRLGLPVIYYISPQVWAWRKRRAWKIAKLVDKMLVIFPFEVEVYRKTGLDVEFVGNPIVESAVCTLSKAEARRELGVDESETVVALLPGSRTSEITRLLDIMLGAGALINKRLGKKAVYVLAASHSFDEASERTALDASGIDVRVVTDSMYTALRASDAAIVASGTASLETALIGTPMVIVYIMSAITYAVARAIVDLKLFGLPNIVAGRKVVEEYIQNEVNPETLSAEVLNILNNPARRTEIKTGYKEITDSLGAPGAARNAATAVLDV